MCFVILKNKYYRTYSTFSKFSPRVDLMAEKTEFKLVDLHLFVFVIGLFCLHRFFCLIGLLHFNQRGARHAEDTVNVDPHLHLHLGALAGCLWDDLLDEKFTWMV